MRLIISLFAIVWWCWAFPASAQHLLQVGAKTEAGEKVLRKFAYKSHLPDSASAQKEIKNLLSTLQAEGYLLSFLAEGQASVDSTSVLISVGSQFRWARLEAGTVEPQWLNRTSWRRRSFMEKPFRYQQAAQLLEQLVEQAEDAGYPFAAARLDSVSLEGELLKANIQLEKGPYIVFDTLKVEGKSRISPKFLAAHLGIKPGEPYSQQKVDAAASRLRSLPYIRLQQAPRLSFQNEQATLFLDLEDKRSNVLDGIIGLLPDPQEEGRLLITGQFDLQLQNPFGRGKEVELHWQRMNRNSQNLEVAYFHPYLFGSIISLQSRFNLLKEEEKFVNRQLNLEAQFRQGINNLLSVLIEQKDSRLLSEADHAGYASFQLSQLGLGFKRNQLNDPFLPSRGYHLSMQLSGGEKEVRALPALANPDGGEPAGGLSGGTTAVGKSMQYRGITEFRYYFPLKQQLVWAHSVQVGLLADKNLFLNDLYRLGGLSSLRGFREKSFFASDYVLSRLELRYLSGEETYLFLFYDQALMEQKVGNLHVNDWPLGFGAGLSLGTNSGTFNFVYGLGKAESQTLNLTQSQVHFGYINRF